MNRHLPSTPEYADYVLHRCQESTFSFQPSAISLQFSVFLVYPREGSKRFCTITDHASEGAWSQPWRFRLDKSYSTMNILGNKIPGY
jgi:hypothetical protein